MKQLAITLLACFIIAAPLRAEPVGRTITASDPGSIVAALSVLGLDPELTVDGIGDPMITSRQQEGVLTVFFFGCDEDTNDGCQSIRLQVGFNRENPWNASEAIQLSREFPFLAVRMDEEGDPYVHWDLYLGEGIPESVFLRNVDFFTDSVAQAAMIVYSEELAAQEQ